VCRNFGEWKDRNKTYPTDGSDSIPYIKDWITNHHPQAGNLNSILLCGFGKSLNRVIDVTSLNRTYQDYKKEFFPKLLTIQISFSKKGLIGLIWMNYFK
jgi:hypothetical protein